MKRWIVIVGLAACGGEAARAVVADAGGLLQDAGSALVEAGAELQDASSRADAQEPPAPVQPVVLESEQDVEMTVGDVTYRWAVFDAEVTELRTAWCCGDLASGGGTDKLVPGGECYSGRVTTAPGKLWVWCGGQPGLKVRVVLDR